MDVFQTFDHTGNDRLDDVDSELSCGSRGAEGVNMRTQGRREKTIVYTV
jgi:hypothetical protein